LHGKRRSVARYCSGYVGRRAMRSSAMAPVSAYECLRIPTDMWWG
jgi:hypothetical protein